MEENNLDKPHVIVEVLDSGPIKISGKIHINDMQRANEEDTSEVLLCRCGRSKNKPYCDDSHKTS